MLLPQTLYLIEACNNIYSNPPSLFSPIQLRTFLRFLIHSTTADTSSSISPFACTPLTNALPGPANPHIAVACLWIHGCDIRCLCPAATAAATYGLSLSWLFLQPPQQPLTGCLCPAATAEATYGLLTDVRFRDLALCRTALVNIPEACCRYSHMFLPAR